MEAFGAAVNIITIIHITADVIKRLNDCKATVEGLPRALQALSVELPVLNNSLKRIRQAIEDGLIPEDSKEALEPLIKDFEQQVRALLGIMDKMRPRDNSSTSRNWKALTSFRYDGEVEHIEGVIRGYVSTLTLESAVRSSDKGMVVPTKKPISPRAVGLFRRDPHFVSRLVLDELQLKSSVLGSRLALVGIGGIGKSQLAIEHGHRIRDTSDDTWVFWVRAATVARFEESYRQIAKAVGISRGNESGVSTLEVVHEWLSNERNGKWVMVVDNADDMEIWTTTVPPMGAPVKVDQNHGAPIPAARRLHSFLPDSRNGSILITSRNREVARLLAGSYSQILQVDEMNELEAMELFSRKSGGGHDPADIAMLTEKLDYIPLAISQAASYIAERAGRMTISKYLTELRNLDQKAIKILDASIDEPHRDEDRSNSVVATWMISFRHIQTTMPSAARLLSLMCLFDRQRIPEDLLVEQYTPETVAIVKRKPWWWRGGCFGRKTKAPESLCEKSEIPTDCNFERDYLTLNNYALIKTDKDGQHFEMHRLIQLTTKRWLELQNTLSSWTSRYIVLMHNNYPWPEYESWNKCQALFPHAQMARRYRPTDPALLENWGFLLQNAAAYAHEKGLFQDADDLNRTAASAFESTLGKAHPNTLRLLNNLADTLYSLNRFSEAENMHRRILSHREKIYGEAHEETLKTVYMIGNILLSQGKLSESETMYRRVLKVREKQYGITHRDTRLVAMKLMGNLRSQGREEEADELLIRAFPSDLNEEQS